MATNKSTNTKSTMNQSTSTTNKSDKNRSGKAGSMQKDTGKTSRNTSSDRDDSNFREREE